MKTKKWGFFKKAALILVAAPVAIGASPVLLAHTAVAISLGALAVSLDNQRRRDGKTRD